MTIISRDVIIASLVGALALVAAVIYFFFVPIDPGYGHIDASNWTNENPHRSAVHPPRLAASSPR